jgi:hypothetical protein
LAQRRVILFFWPIRASSANHISILSLSTAFSRAIASRRAGKFFLNPRLRLRLAYGGAGGPTACDTVGEPLAQVGEKFPSRLPAAVANVPRGNQLRVRVDRGPRQNIASLTFKLLFDRGVCLFGINERPDFIDLNALAGQVYEGPVLVVEAGFFTSESIVFQRQHDAQASNPQYNHPANNMIIGSVHWVAFAVVSHVLIASLHK